MTNSNELSEPNDEFDRKNQEKQLTNYPLSLKNEYEPIDLLNAARSSVGREGNNDKILLDFVVKSGLYEQITQYLANKGFAEDTHTNTLLNAVKAFSKAAKKRDFDRPVGAFFNQLRWCASSEREKFERNASGFSVSDKFKDNAVPHSDSKPAYDKRKITEQKRRDRFYNDQLTKKLETTRRTSPFRYEVIVKMNEFKVLVYERDALEERFKNDLRKPKRLQAAINKEKKKNPPNKIKVATLERLLDEVVNKNHYNIEIRRYLDLYVLTQNQWLKIGADLLGRKIVPKNILDDFGNVKKWYLKKLKGKKPQPTPVTVDYIAGRARKEYSAWTREMKKAPE